MDFQFLSLVLLNCLGIALGTAHFGIYGHGMHSLNGLATVGGAVGVGTGPVISSIPGGGVPMVSGYQGVYGTGGINWSPAFYGSSAGPYGVSSGPLATVGGMAVSDGVSGLANGGPYNPGYVSGAIAGANTAIPGYPFTGVSGSASGVYGLSGGASVYGSGAYGSGAYARRIQCFRIGGSSCPARSWYAGNCGSKKKKCKICCVRICHPKEPCNYV